MTCILIGATSVLLAEPAKESAKRMKPVLLVIDVQNEYLPYMSEEGKKLATETINAAIWLFRQKGFPVIRVYHTDPAWGPKVDSEGFEFPKSIQIQSDDPKIIKNYPSAFKKTELEKLLRTKGCNTLFLCGLSAVGCVLATYHTAQDLDFDVFMVQNGLLSQNFAFTQTVQQFCDSVGFAALKVMLENAEK
jgi:nicotinamidase-related amidase